MFMRRGSSGVKRRSNGNSPTSAYCKIVILLSEGERNKIYASIKRVYSIASEPTLCWFFVLRAPLTKTLAFLHTYVIKTWHSGNELRVQTMSMIGRVQTRTEGGISIQTPLM